MAARETHENESFDGITRSEPDARRRQPIVSLCRSPLSTAFLIAVPVVVFQLALGDTLRAADPQSSKPLQELRDALRQAGKLYQAGKYRESAELVQRIQRRYGVVEASTARAKAQKTAVFQSLRKAHALLELEGFSLPPLPELESQPLKGPSYIRQIAPILKLRCGTCHIDDNQGEFSMATYTQLIAGGGTGPAIRRRRANASLVIRRIRAGEMPPDGPPVAADELQLLATWIDRGALFDGDAEREPIVAEAVPANRAPQANNDSISFSKQIAPLLAQHCVACHGENNPRNNLSLIDFARIQRGGDAGPLWLAGKPEESLILKKLRGTAEGQRMPLNRPALSDEQLSVVSRWIEFGAMYDGVAPSQNVLDLAVASRLQSATASELNTERKQLALQTWNLVFPNQAAEVIESQHFLWVANAAPNVLNDYGNMADALYEKIIRVLRFPSTAQALKGRITVFVVDSGYDYSEFARMVEKRSIPPTWTGHWRTPGLDAYVVGLRPKTSEESERFQEDLCRNTAAAMLELSGSLPPWFVVGAAEAAAAKIDSRSSRARRLRQELPAVVASMDKADDLLKATLSPKSQEIASAAFVQMMMKNSRAFVQLLQDIDNGQDFHEAVAKRFGEPVENLVVRWWQMAAN